jgi:hypothetical protein
MCPKPAKKKQPSKKEGHDGGHGAKWGVALALVAEAVGQGLASGTVEKGVEEVLKLLNDHPAAQSETLKPKKDPFSDPESLHDFCVTIFHENGSENTFNRKLALREAVASTYAPAADWPIESTPDDKDSVRLSVELFAGKPAVELAIPKDRLMNLCTQDGYALSGSDLQSLKQISIAPQKKGKVALTLDPGPATDVKPGGPRF